MPSQFDTSYHEVFRKPTFDDENSKKIYQLTKEADEVLEMRQPPIPTQEMEREYMDFLQEDFKSDPWLTYRFRKYTANPKRIPWKNQRRIKRQYQYTFMCNWMLGSALAWPVATAIGRSMKTSKGGVPAVRLNRWVHDFPQPEPGRSSRLIFRYYAVASCALIGYVFARQVTDTAVRCSNAWYNRPDLKPYPAMVKQPGDMTKETMLEAQYINKQGSSWSTSPLYRFFFAREADWSIKENPYANSHSEDVWDSRKGQFSTYSNRFGDHHQ